MYFSKYEAKFYRKTKLNKLLEQFEQSGMEIAKLEDWNYSTAVGGAGNINRAAKIFGYLHIKARARNGEIFLCREEI